MQDTVTTARGGRPVAAGTGSSLGGLLSTWFGMPDELLVEARRQVRRFAVSVGAFGAVVGSAWLAAALVGLADWSTARVIPAAALVAASVSALVALATTSRRITDRAVVYLGLANVVFVCGLTSAVHALHQVDIYGHVTAFGPYAIVIAVLPIILPCPPRLTLLGALAATFAALLGLALGMRWAGESVAATDPSVVLDIASVPLACAAVAYAGSRMMSRLRADVLRARRMGSYELEEKLGEGGMGEVWRARHHMLARPAAVKLIRPRADADGQATAVVASQLERFAREAKATAALGSHHTVRLYDFGVTDDGTFYYAMELLDGLDLSALVTRHGPQPPERVQAILVQACDSLAEAHDHGLVHRDIKPANLMLCRQGRSVDVVKVLDFGIVGVRADAAAPAAHGIDPSLTQPGAVLGTPAYMSPEALTGDGADLRSDLYALGCVAYWLLTGRRVFEATNHVELMAAHLRDPVTPPSAVVPGVPVELEAVVLRCLAKDPALRYASADALAEELRALQLEAPWDQARARAWWAEREAGGAPDRGGPTGATARPTAVLDEPTLLSPASHLGR